MCGEEKELDRTGTYCFDNHKGSCWTEIREGICEYNLPETTLKEECCCSIGKAWGSPCVACNKTDCGCGEGFAKINRDSCVDIDECSLDPNICQGGGICINTEGSFTCSCPPGLILDETQTQCLDLRKEFCYIDVTSGECLEHVEVSIHCCQK